MAAVLKTPGEIELLDQANRIVHQVLDEVGARIAPGVTTKELDRLAERVIRDAGGVPAFLNYRGYPATLCISVNDVIVHGIPSRAKLQEGDIIGLDFGSILDGFVGDGAITIGVGNVAPRAQELMDTTRECLELAIKEMVPGNHLGDIGAAVQEHAEAHGFHVIRNFVGHGIGRRMHEDPQVYNYGRRGRGLELKEGMVLAIEPMLCEIGPKLKSRIQRANNDGMIEDVRTDADRWTARTLDGTLAAHFEHSVAITGNGPMVLGK